jgi:hypothetical protein
MAYLEAVIKKESEKGVLFAINPAFWSGQGIR